MEKKSLFVFSSDILDSDRWVWTPRAWTKVTKDTGVGNPKKATADKGKRYLADLTDQIAGFLMELGRSNPTKLYR